LEQRAKALEKIGIVRLEQGHSPAAMESFQAAAKIAGKLARTTTSNMPYQLSYAEILTFIGKTYWYQGKLDDAQRAYKSAQTVIQHMNSPTPADPQVKSQLEAIDNNIGHILETRGQLQEAELQYRNSLALSEAVAVAAPTNANRSEVGNAHNNLGKLELARGDLVAAINEYTAQDAIESQLSMHDPKNNDQREAMIIARATLGRTLALAGDSETGAIYLQQAVDFSNRLSAVDPHNTSFQEDVALYPTQLARLRRLRGDLPAAQALSTRAITIFAAMTKQDPSNSGWQREYADALVEQAAQSSVAKATAAALAQAQTALKILHPLFASQPDDRDILLSTTRTKLLLAVVSGDAQEAANFREDALKAMRSVKAGRNDMRLLALQVETLLALHQNTTAQPLIEQLRRSGYRDLALMDILRRERINYPPDPTFQAKLLAARRPKPNVSQAEAAK